MTTADVSVAVPAWAVAPVIALSVFGFVLRKVSLERQWRLRAQDFWLGWAWMFAGGVLALPGLFLVTELIELSHAITGAASSVASGK